MYKLPVSSSRPARYANLASTDAGFFGKGLYSAHEAAYAHRVYSKGALIVNWVAIGSAYPVMAGDALGGGKPHLRPQSPSPVFYRLTRSPVSKLLFAFEHSLESYRIV
jgi:hypothetical protein